MQVTETDKSIALHILQECGYRMELVLLDDQPKRINQRPGANIGRALAFGIPMGLVTWAFIYLVAKGLISWLT